MSENLSSVVTIFKALSDETRIRILHLLARTGEALCVCELTDALEVPQYNISRHLKVMVQAGLLDRQKIGRWVYFRLPQSATLFLDFVLQALTSLDTERTRRDLVELKKRLHLRTNGRCTIGIQKNHLIGKK